MNMVKASLNICGNYISCMCDIYSNDKEHKISRIHFYETMGLNKHKKYRQMNHILGLYFGKETKYEGNCLVFGKELTKNIELHPQHTVGDISKFIDDFITEVEEQMNRTYVNAERLAIDCYYISPTNVKLLYCGPCFTRSNTHLFRIIESPIETDVEGSVISIVDSVLPSFKMN